MPSRRQELTFLGKTMTLGEWCKVLDVPYGTINARLNRGMSTEEAFTTPIGGSLVRGQKPREIRIPDSLRGQ